MAHSKHTTKVFDADLQELARAIAEMGGLAERQIAEAIEALMTRERPRPAGRHGCGHWLTATTKIGRQRTAMRRRAMRRWRRSRKAGEGNER